jgi:FkbM family methyltransferase
MEDFYKNIKIKDNITNIKLDIGLSYNAPHSHIWLENDSNLLVIGFEPNINCVNNILNKNIVKRHAGHSTPISNEYINDRFFIFPIALSNVEKPCEMIFYETENDCGCSSLFKPIDKTFGNYNVEQYVKVYSLKHFFDLFPFDRFQYIDYIKIDAQGSDLDILKGAGNYLQEKVVYITAEPEDKQYENCCHNNSSNIENYLKTQNFIRVHNRNTVDPTFLNKKFSHLADKIFIRQL